MEKIEQKLNELFPPLVWKIDNPPAGESKQAFVADNGQEKVFLKFGVKSQVLKRLSELEVAPAVLYDGTEEAKPYVVQEFIEGSYPEVSWFSKNINTLADFIKRYQEDETLKTLLENGITYQEHIGQELAHIEQEIKSTVLKFFKTERVTEGIGLLKERSKGLKPVILVPTHADPNAKNFLLTDKGVTMIDWDDIGLSDPMKDVGLMLWWYIPTDKWPAFFKAYGKELDEEKIYWWSANASLSIACWFDKRGDSENAKFFLEDFFLALQRKGNSQLYSSYKY